MASTIGQIADAVVDVINGATLSQALTATKRSVPKNRKADLTAAVADVRPRGAVNTNGGTRSRVHTDFAVDVGVAKDIDNTEAAFDGMLNLFDEVDALFRNSRLSGFTSAIWQRSEYVIADEDAIENKGVYLGVITLVFGVTR